MISLSPALTLDPDHVYRLGQRTVVSVTQILKAENLIDARFFNDDARQRGVAVHAAVEQDERGILDEAFLDSRIGDYLEGWRRFKREKGYVTSGRVPKGGKGELYAEVRMHSISLDLAGTADGIGTMDGIKGLALADVKSGDPSPATSLQVAAYAGMFFEHTGQIIAARFAVQLTAQGGYYLHRYNDLNDYLTFRAVLQTHRWRARNLPAYQETLMEAVA
jgi:hypothetical protein